MKAGQRDVLLFDLDGTLVDSAPDLALAVNDTLQQLGLETFPEQTIRGWVGNGAQVLIERGLSGSVDIDPQLDRELAARALTIFLESYRQNLCVKSCLYPAVAATLLALKERGYRLAIVTNKPEQFVAPILEGLGLAGLFEVLVGGDTLPEKKPEPAPLHYACEQMVVSLDRCIMVGDSRNDILAAKAAVIPSVGLTYGYNYGEDIAAYGCEWVLDDFSGLLEILD